MANLSKQLCEFGLLGATFQGVLEEQLERASRMLLNKYA